MIESVRFCGKPTYVDVTAVMRVIAAAVAIVSILALTSVVTAKGSCN